MFCYNCRSALAHFLCNPSWLKRKPCSLYTILSFRKLLFLFGLLYHVHLASYKIRFNPPFSTQEKCMFQFRSMTVIIHSFNVFELLILIRDFPFWIFFGVQYCCDLLFTTSPFIQAILHFFRYNLFSHLSIVMSILVLKSIQHKTSSTSFLQSITFSVPYSLNLFKNIKEMSHICTPDINLTNFLEIAKISKEWYFCCWPSSWPI